jgi:hypothetical protein
MNSKIPEPILTASTGKFLENALISVTLGIFNFELVHTGYLYSSWIYFHDFPKQKSVLYIFRKTNDVY